MASAITKPAAAAGKLAKNCTACRASKVKCQVNNAASCTRCERLGLQCIFVETRRGQSCVKRDRARLGPVARALLRATAAGDAIQDEIDRTRAADDQPFCWTGNDCQRTMVQSISTAEGQLALMKHWLLVGVRSGSCGLLGNVLLLAHSCSISLDEVNVAIARPLTPITPAELELPPYISGWLEDAGRLCCVRSQVHGAVSWQPNATFVREVGDEAALRRMLHATVPGLNESVDYLTCMAEMFLAVPIHAEDRSALARLNGLLWSSLAPLPDGVRVAEAVAPVLVRCQLRRPDATGAAAEYSLCALSGRSIVLPESHAVHSAFSLVPHSTTAPGASSLSLGAPPGALPASPPVGLPQWPLDEVSEEMIAAAQARQDQEGSAGYDLLEDLGLELDLADVDMLMTGDPTGMGAE